MAGKSMKGASKLPRRDDLPFVKSSRLRALKVIAHGQPQAEIEVGGLVRAVKLWHMALPHGGGWSFFICPNCARRCRTLRLYDGKLVCARCDGLYLRCQRGDDGKPDKGPRIARLRAMLASEGLRVGGKRSRHRLDRKKRIETALRRALIVQRQQRLEKWTKARERAKRSIKRSSKKLSSTPAAT